MSETAQTALYYSDLAEDEDLAEIVELFVEEMPDRIGQLQSAADEKNWELLGRLAHQIKGAAGSYGFHGVTSYALSLEVSAKQGEQEDTILHALGELTAICRQLRSGTP